MTFKKDLLTVNIDDTRAQMGLHAAEDIAACMRNLLSGKESINMCFAAAPSQNDVLESLLSMPLPWDRVNAFHMDEYVGLKKEDKQSFGYYLDEHIFKKVPFKAVYYVADYGLDYAKIRRKRTYRIQRSRCGGFQRSAANQARKAGRCLPHAAGARRLLPHLR